MRLTFKSNSRFKTKKIASLLAKEMVRIPAHKALVLALEGDLGSGKTTFTQGFVRSLGVKEKILSPTFVLMKVYSISQKPKAKRQKFKHLVHIDCYRIKFLRELTHLGLKKTLKDKDAIILIEWADRIRKLMPKDAIWIKFQHGKRPNERIIKIKN